MTESMLPSRRAVLLTLTAALFFFCHAVPVQATLVDKVVAVVNGEIITLTELDKAGAKTFDQIRQTAPPAELDNLLAAARLKVLDKLIDELLISQKGLELQIKVSEQDLDNATATIARENGLTLPRLYEELARTGVSKEEYRHNLSSQILNSKVLSYEIRSKIVINGEKGRDYYDTVYTKQKTASGYHLLQIGLLWDEESDPDSKAEIRQEAEGLRKLAVDGQDFKELARSFSQLPSAKDGGDLGFFTDQELADNLRETFINLTPGQISAVIETKNSFQFFQLLVKNLNGNPEFAPYEMISEEINHILYQEEVDKRYKKWLTEIKDRAIINKLL